MIQCPDCEGRGRIFYNIGEDFDRVGECGTCEGFGAIEVHCENCQKVIEGLTFSGMCEECYAIQCPVCGEEKEDRTREFCPDCREQYGERVESEMKARRLAGVDPLTLKPEDM
jgi:hypothetical protein